MNLKFVLHMIMTKIDGSEEEQRQQDNLNCVLSGRLMFILEITTENNTAVRF